MNVTKEVEELLNRAAVCAGKMHHEYITPEHFLYVLAEDQHFCGAFERCGGETKQLKDQIKDYLDENMEAVVKESSHIQISYGLKQILEAAAVKAHSCDKDSIEVSHLVHAMMELEECYGAYLIEVQEVDKVSLLYEMGGETIRKQETDKKKSGGMLRQYAVYINEEVEYAAPLIGREEELERTMQVLCRRYKNNPLHIGEPGVGKTAITYGLARRILEGKVPDRLKNANIYAVDMGTLIAGTQFRGDFEKRLKGVIEELRQEENPILYIDEIHNLVGAGAVSGGSMDASNLLKPYLTSGEIRFIGATTYEEYKKHFSKDKSLVRRFQTIEIKEPSIEETVEILNGLKSYYEAFHQVKYLKGTMNHAASLSAQYLNERFLPDKAIDLIDEAGAFRQMHPKQQKLQTVDKRLIEEVISKICHIPKQTIETEEKKKLSQLDKQLKERVFGQSDAIKQLVNAIKLSKAGLTDDQKPICSLLFVGPTGVGKTELAKSVSELLGMDLIRFDMSEYAEKHTVAKLIGAPAGYVGYEEGGILTESVRKHPQCVLLLDEIEKAHSDIFNVLLQVMDYATLTDNQGRKANFRNVILIMTSNAGAAVAGKPALGFGGEELNEGAITDEVQRVFSPEFRNRLDQIVYFHPLNPAMAEKIVVKELNYLSKKLADKQITLTLSKAGKEYLKKKGLSREYGAREIKRVINQEIKPLLVDQILFGSLKKGGECQIDFDGTKLCLILRCV